MDWQTEKAIKSVEAQAEMRATFAKLSELGILVDSGSRRPNRYGDLETVYVLAPDAERRFETAFGQELSAAAFGQKARL